MSCGNIGNVHTVRHAEARVETDVTARLHALDEEYTAAVNGPPRRRRRDPARRRLNPTPPESDAA